jgi:hypothetical protein
MAIELLLFQNFTLHTKSVFGTFVLHSIEPTFSISVEGAIKLHKKDTDNFLLFLL